MWNNRYRYYGWEQKNGSTRCLIYSLDPSSPLQSKYLRNRPSQLVGHLRESWTTKKAECPRIDALELWCWRRLLGISWTARRSNLVHLKGNQPWIFIGRTDAEAPTLWPPDVNSWLIEDSDTTWQPNNLSGLSSFKASSFILCSIKIFFSVLSSIYMSC